MRNLPGSTGRIAAGAVLAGVFLLTGCATDQVAAQLAESVAMFIEDFARQVLAAYLS